MSYESYVCTKCGGLRVTKSGSYGWGGTWCGCAEPGKPDYQHIAGCGGGGGGGKPMEFRTLIQIPLTHERILELWDQSLRDKGMVKKMIVEFARLLESEHGIGK